MNREDLDRELDALVMTLTQCSIQTDLGERQEAIMGILKKSFLVSVLRERMAAKAARPFPLSSGPYRERKGESGVLHMNGRQLDGAHVDLANVYADGSLEVTLSFAHGPYDEGARIHVSVWEYEKLAEGTV